VANLNSSLNEFQPATTEEISKILTTSANKTCSLDAIPTWLIKNCVAEVTPAVTSIVNSSLQEAYVPPIFKHALVTPLLKKSNLDKNLMSNYRPVSNLNFLSKVLERLVSSRLKNYLSAEGLAAKFQSAYREFHSTETALLRVHNDIIRYADQKQCSALILLDLSAAFDTIDQDLLLQRLRVYFGIGGSALKWLESYLKDRSQSVHLTSSASLWSPSRLSPWTCVIYTLHNSIV